jgi:[acyl-carrier-protein] S-malonyltransferase
MTLVFMFPGQSSRYADMLDRVLEAFPEGRGVVEEASALLGRDLVARYRGGEAVFEKNQDVQVGVFLTSHLHLLALEARGVRASLSLGLSLGEYNHLVHIGALPFSDALRLVDERGRVYDAGPAGMMAAVFPVELEELEGLVARARSAGVLEVANHNSPSQFVVAGERAAVEALMALAEEELAVDPVVIERHIPMHTSVFAPAALAFRPALERAPWRRPEKPYLSNVLGTFADAAAEPRAQFVDLLTRHVQSPVRWRESIDTVCERHADAVFVEVGPRGVLTNLLQKRWHANRKFKSDVPEGLTGNFAVLAAELAPLSGGAHG